VLPAAVVSALPDWPPLTDLAELVGALADEHDVTFLEAPPAARRVADDSDLRVLEALEVSD
jgi:2-C-methyl-D-erythritol 4-phosphate cytidylyltransferase